MCGSRCFAAAEEPGAGYEGVGVVDVDARVGAPGSHFHNENSATADGADTKGERCQCQGVVRAAAETDGA